MPRLFRLLCLLCLACSGTAEREQPVVVYGDTRTGHDAHRAVLARIVVDRPTMVFHVGDLVADGTNAADWAVFNNIIGALPAGTPLYPAAGNHERESALFYENFGIPPEVPWYEVDARFARFFILNSNLPLDAGSPQLGWLAAALSNAIVTAPRVPRILVLHHPLVSSGPHPADERGQGAVLFPLLATYRVTAVFAGHQHLYERSVADGITHIVSGGGGAPLHQVTETNPASRCLRAIHHHTRLIPEDGGLRLVAVDTNGTVFDQAWLPDGFGDDEPRNPATLQPCG